MKLFDATISTLQRALDARMVRQNVLAGNMANVDTPGFVPKDVDVAAAFRELPSGGEVSRPTAPTVEGHLPVESREAGDSYDLPITAAPSSNPGIDGNGVDLDRTLVGMAENALQYGAAAKAAGKKLAMLRYVASDGNA
jgi:flagellar basal-body rod protein FlgB